MQASSGGSGASATVQASGASVAAQAAPTLIDGETTDTSSGGGSGGAVAAAVVVVVCLGAVAAAVAYRVKIQRRPVPCLPYNREGQDVMRTVRMVRQLVRPVLPSPPSLLPALTCALVSSCAQATNEQGDAVATAGPPSTWHSNPMRRNDQLRRLSKRGDAASSSPGTGVPVVDGKFVQV